MRIIAALLLFLSIGLPSEGQTYYLPKTAVRFHLLIEKQTYTPGDFAAYAERYLHMSNIEQQEQVSHRVVTCLLTTAGVRDTTKCYTLRLKGKGEAADVRLSDDGILLAVNAEPVQFNHPIHPPTLLSPNHASNLPRSSFLPRFCLPEAQRRWRN